LWLLAGTPAIAVVPAVTGVFNFLASLLAGIAIGVPAVSDFRFPVAAGDPAFAYVSDVAGILAIAVGVCCADVSAVDRVPKFLTASLLAGIIVGVPSVAGVLQFLTASLPSGIVVGVPACYF
jgi:hypothetical protein